MTKQRLQFSIEDIDMIEENPYSQFATARIQAFSSDKNRHDLFCSEDTLKETAESIYDKPILYSIDNTLDDFYTHTTPASSLICGFVVPDSAEFIRLPDSRLALSVTAKIWKRYAPKVMELFKRDKGNKKVSVEMELYETSPIDNILTKMVSFAYTGICILGTYVTEASPGANIQVLSFAEDAVRYEKIVKEEFSKKEVSFSIPAQVKAVALEAVGNNKKKGGGNSVALSIAKLLTTKDSISDEEIQHIKSRITRFTNGTNFNLCGGSAFIDWSNSLSSQKDIDDSLSKGEENKEGMEIKMADETKKEDEVVVEMASTPVSEEKETPEEEKAETPAEDKKEKEEGTEKKFEFPSNFDFEKMAALFSDDEDEDVKMAKEEFGKSEAVNPQVVLAGMFAKMCKMSDAMTKMAEDNKTYMAENEELKKFKADFESSQKAFAVEKMIKELEDKVVLPDEAREEMISESKRYSFSEIGTWQTYCKAKSFEFALKKEVTNDSRIGLNWFGSDVSKKSEELW